MRTFFLATLVILTLSACGQRPWTEHVYADWGFAASSPSQPVKRDTSRNEGGRTIRAVAVEGAGQDKDLSIGVIELTGVEKPADQLMSESVRAIAAGRPVNVAYWALGERGQHMGRAAVIDEGNGMKLALRVLVANGRLYQVSARSLGTTSPRATRFLDSFRLIEPAVVAP
jgi:hypothetical protein